MCAHTHAFAHKRAQQRECSLFSGTRKAFRKD